MTWVFVCPNICRETNEDSTPINVEHFLDCIHHVSLFAPNQIRTRLRIECPNKNRNKFNLSISETTWLCWSAFNVIFDANMNKDDHPPTDLLLLERIAERVRAPPTGRKTDGGGHIILLGASPTQNAKKALTKIERLWNSLRGPQFALPRLIIRVAILRLALNQVFLSGRKAGFNRM